MSKPYSDTMTTMKEGSICECDQPLQAKPRGAAVDMLDGRYRFDVMSAPDPLPTIADMVSEIRLQRIDIRTATSELHGELGGLRGDVGGLRADLAVFRIESPHLQLRVFIRIVEASKGVQLRSFVLITTTDPHRMILVVATIASVVIHRACARCTQHETMQSLRRGNQGAESVRPDVQPVG